VDDSGFPVMIVIGEMTAGIDFVDNACLDLFMDIFDQNVVMV
jgi:hypothetical protein